MDKPKDTEDKLSWCEYGDDKEIEFIGLHGRELGLIANPSKKLLENGKYLPDLYDLNLCLACDLKTIREPFFKAFHLYKMNPSTTITLNVKDLERYNEKYPHIYIIFWVEWEAQTRFNITVTPLKGLWRARVRTLNDIVKKSPIHFYKNRVEDNNAKNSYLIDISGLQQMMR